jgi:hypothetical protein
MAYEDAEARIATLLETLAITEPEVQRIKRVYTEAPGTIADLPCVILTGPEVIAVNRANSIRSVVYALPLQLLLTDADVARAQSLLKAYRKAIIDLFDVNQTLQGIATVVEGPTDCKPASFTYGAKKYTGFDALLTVHIEEGKAFSG